MSQPRPPLDALGFLAYLFYAAVGGLLLFGFAQMLGQALAEQRLSSCRSLQPTVLTPAPVPTLALQDLTGQSADLADLRGKFVVVNFWASWCEPCIQEWPDLAQLAERLHDQPNVVVVAISLDKTLEDARNFLTNHGISDSRVRVLWDPSGQAGRLFGSEKIPDTYFVNEQGELIHAYIDARKWGSPAAYACVTSMME